MSLTISSGDRLIGSRAVMSNRRLHPAIEFVCDQRPLVQWTETTAVCHGVLGGDPKNAAHLAPRSTKTYTRSLTNISNNFLQTSIKH